MKTLEYISDFSIYRKPCFDILAWKSNRATFLAFSGRIPDRRTLNPEVNYFALKMAHLTRVLSKLVLFKRITDGVWVISEFVFF